MYSFDESGNPLIDSEAVNAVYNLQRKRDFNPSSRFLSFFQDRASSVISRVYESVVSQVVVPITKALNEVLIQTKMVTRQYQGLLRTTQSTVNGELSNLFPRVFESAVARAFKGYPGVLAVGSFGGTEFRFVVSFDAALIRYCNFQVNKLREAGIPVRFRVIRPSETMNTLTGQGLRIRETAAMLSFSFPGFPRAAVSEGVRCMRAGIRHMPDIVKFFQTISRRMVSVDCTYGEYSRMNIVDPWRRIRQHFGFADVLEDQAVASLMHANIRQLFLDRDSFWMTPDAMRHPILRVTNLEGKIEFTGLIHEGLNAMSDQVEASSEDQVKKGFTETLCEAMAAAPSSGNTAIESFMVLKGFVEKIYQEAGVPFNSEEYFHISKYEGNCDLLDFDILKCSETIPDFLERVMQVADNFRNEATAVDHRARTASTRQGLNRQRLVALMSSLPMYVAPVAEGSEDEDDFI